MKTSTSTTSRNTSTAPLSLSELLSTPPVTPEQYQFLKDKKYRKDRIAQYLNITPAYFYNILSGSKTPSKSLHKRILALIAELKQEYCEVL